MKLYVFGAVTIAALLAGCAKDQQKVVVNEGPLDYQLIYNKPLLSPGGKFGILPPTVQNTIRAQAGSAEILDIVGDQPTNAAVYKITFRNSTFYPPLYVAKDGSLLNPDLTVAIKAPHEAGAQSSGIKLSDLPSEATKVVHEHEADTEIVSIDKETWGDRAVYIITFKDPAHHPKLYIAADGTVLKGGTK